MKRILLASLLTAASLIGFTSCDNGDYNATPDTGGILEGMGAIEASYNGTFKKMSPGIYTVNNHSGVQYLIIYADIYNDNGYYSQALSITIPNYTGPKKYILDNNFPENGTVVYNFIKTAGAASEKMYSSNAGAASVEVNITADAGNVLRANFNGTLVQSSPELNPEDKLTISDGVIGVNKGN